MGIIQATTPTKAGWAQSFDTSGIAALAIKQKEKRAKKLQDMLVEYDTKGIFPRDIDEVQRQVRETENFAMTHANEIANSSQHMGVWREFKDMQAKVKNTITYSITAKEQHDKANRMYHAENGRYMTEANAAALEAYAATPTAEQYTDKTAYADLSAGFERHTDLDYNTYRKIVDNSWVNQPPELTGEQLGDTEKYIYSKDKMIDREKLEKALRINWEKKGLESGDLQHEYKDKGGFDAFVEDAIAMSADPTSYGLAAAPREGTEKAKTAREMEREGAISNVEGSAFDGTETLYTESGAVYKITGPDGKKASAVMQYGYYTEGKVAQINQDVPILLPVTVGYSHNQGRMLDVGEGNKYNKQIVREIRDGFIADRELEIVHTDKKGRTVKTKYQKGEPLPDIKKMWADEAISKDYYLDLLLPGVSRKERLATVQASSAPLGYFDKAEGQKYKDTMADTRSEFITVPYATIKNSFEGAMKKKYGQDYSVEDYLGDLEEEDWTD